MCVLGKPRHTHFLVSMKELLPILLLLILSSCFDKMTPLEIAYEKIEQLPDYSDKIDTTGVELGRVQGIIWPNAKHREEVIKIISEIPDSLIYFKTEQTDKINRYYLYMDETGKEQVLYVVVGHGGNDLVAELVTNSKTELNKEILDLLKKSHEETKVK